MSEILKNAWVVIPAYHEARIVRRVVRGVLPLVPRVVVVDDGSTDETSEEALRAGATVLRHLVNLGQGAALQTGIDYALLQGAERVFTFDADGQHSPESLTVMAEVQKQTGVDVVLGSRALGNAEGIPGARRLMLKAAVALTRAHTGLPVTDTHNGLRLFTRQAAMLIRITQPRMAHASEILSQIHRLGLRYAEAPVTVRYTGYSLAKGQKMTGAFRVLADLLYASWTR
jgi:glycosyltransferase involved in cell wall biosynthesis